MLECPAVAESSQDCLAFGGGAKDLAGAGALALFAIPLRLGDFVAEKQAAGEGGDDEIPALAGGAGGVLDFVAIYAGEGWGRREEAMQIVGEEFIGGSSKRRMGRRGNR